MDNLVKQRLVGALILLALAVIFWPIIFVPTAERGSDISVVVPEPPPVDMTPLPEPDNLALRRGAPAQAQLADEAADVVIPQDSPLLASASDDPADAQSAKDAATVNAPPPLPKKQQTLTQQDVDDARETLKAPAIDDDGLPIAYSLQVATLGDRAGANKLRDALVAAGYKGYIKRLRRDGKILYRVLVGPKYSRDELRPIKSSVDKTWRVESMIIRYLP